MWKPPMSFEQGLDCRAFFVMCKLARVVALVLFRRDSVSSTSGKVSLPYTESWNGFSQCFDFAFRLVIRTASSTVSLLCRLASFSAWSFHCDLWSHLPLCRKIKSHGDHVSWQKSC